MWFLHYAAIFIFVVLGIITLLRYGRAIRRWWLPGGIVAAVGIGTFLTKPDVFGTRTAFNATIPLPPLPQALAGLYGSFTYPASLLWLAIFVIATALILYRIIKSARQTKYASSFGFLIWLALPAVIYVFNSRLGLFQNDRYQWWALPGLVFWIGAGLALLPRRAMPIVAGVIALIALLPFSLDNFQSSQFHDYAPLDYEFALLREYLKPGDVVLLDPNCGCAPNEVWDYFMRIYFPNGLPFVDSPDGYRRVWYVTIDWRRDPATNARVEDGRIAGKYFGPPNFLIRLYEAPPDPVGIPFANGMRYHGVDIERFSTPDGPIYHEGETVKLRLWWSADHAIDLDYSVGTYVFAPDATAETNAPPLPADAPPATSQWQSGQVYVDEREITLPYPLDPAVYPIRLSVYFWQNPTPISAPGADDRGLLDISKVLVHAW